MARILLDTTILVDVLRGRPESTRKLLGLRKQGDVPCTCAVNVEEVVRGLRVSEEAAAGMLLAGLTLLPLGHVEGTTAGRWRRDYAKRGRSLAQGDCLIAAAAAEANATLATGNPKDFPMTDVLDVEHWPAGE